MQPTKGKTGIGFIIFCLTIVTLSFLLWKKQAATPPAGVEQGTATVSSAPAPAAEPTVTPSAVTLSEPAPNGLPPVIPLALKPYFAEGENTSFLKENILKWLPKGAQTIASVDFQIDGIILLQAQGSENDDQLYRSTVSLPLAKMKLVSGKVPVRPLGQSVGSIHLLGGTRYGGEVGSKIADVMWHYDDGSIRTTPLLFAVQLRDWRRTRYEQPTFLPDPGAKAVWREELDTAGDSYRRRLYRLTLDNPEPDKTIQRLDFVSGMANPSLMLVAISLDPLKLGERPDDSPNLEDEDALLSGSLLLTVQDQNGILLSGANVKTEFTQKLEGKSVSASVLATTDTSGSAAVKFPSQGLETLMVKVSRAGYSSRRILWDVSGGDLVPLTHLMKLQAGISIGGWVVDGAGQPIGGAKISLTRFWTSEDPRKQKGEGAEFSSAKQTADAQGHWQVDDLPESLLGNISASASHPDYMGGSVTVGDGGQNEKELRAGTFKFVLKGGLQASGRVIGDKDQPIAGATVWSAGRDYRERQETKTDAAGKFHFGKLKEGSVPFSVSAKGWTPTDKTVEVKADMAEIVFKLEPGGVIRGVVQDDAGSPISGVRMVLEGNGDIGRTYTFSTTTDETGRFLWDAAPNKPMPFYIGKTGYEQRRDYQLKPNEENVVILRKPRKILGQVLDAETEQPVSKFRAGSGRSYETGRMYVDYPGMKGYADEQGFFTLELNEEQNNALKVEADNYAEKIEEIPKTEEREIKMIFRLKPSPGVEGIVVAPDGTPVAGASVALTTEGFSGKQVRYERRQFKDYSRQATIVTTDAAGKFSLPSPPETGGTVVATAEVGFGSASVEEVRQSGRIVLQSLGKVEGTITVGGKPLAGQGFMLSLDKIGLSMNWEAYRTSSDDQGRFHFDDVPTGRGEVIRLIKSSPNSWTHSHNTPVQILPGQTAYVTFGESGASVAGQVVWETAPEEKATLSASLSTKLPELPPNLTPQERSDYYKSDEWKELTKGNRHFAVNIDDQGNLSMDSIPPGTYQLHVSARVGSPNGGMGKTVGSAPVVSVTIPENATPGTTIQIPTITLKPVAPKNQ